ncbi:MAG: succinate dehydrogenase cytochrome b subunit [Gemmatimonadaceae bacterium]|nr:succinate dehydrogenase cytochrome b subunit [Gemmatimonadaceae bacterium]
MSRLLSFARSTIGLKVIMALSGLVGIGFVLGHMTGNLLMFKGQGAMHDYAVLLRTSMPLLWGVRLALIAAVVLHIWAAYTLTMRSNAARPVSYAERRPQVSTLASRTMKWGGVLLLAFIVFHLLDLTLGAANPRFEHLDPFNNVIYSLKRPLIAVFYVAAMLALGMHLYHGAWSSFRTLGLARPSARPLHRNIAIAVAAIVAAGFILIPLATLFGAFTPTR